MKLVPPLERLGNIGSAAERRVAALIQQVDLGEPSVCFYSVHLPRHEYKRMAEIDFLIVLGDVVLVIEVKGGRVSRGDGVWLFTNRYGEVNEKHEGPFDQARSAMFALEKELIRRIPALDVKFSSVVITPDQPMDPDLEWHPAEHFGPSTMSVAALEKALTATTRHVRATGRARGRNRSWYQELLGVLRPDFDRVPRLSQLATAFESDYLALASEQYQMLRGSEINDRIYCTGGAGSGKTLLAVETARRAAGAGERVLLTCRSEGIIGLVGRSLEGTGVTCLAWPRAIGMDPFDMLVVDEAQDLMNLDDYVGMDALVEGGLRDGRWRLFSDPNNQAHVAGAFDAEVEGEIRRLAAGYHLPYNCRNTSAVVRQTHVLTGANIGEAKVGEGPAVQFERPATEEDAAALLDAQLKRLRREEVHPSDIVVVTLREDLAASAATKSKAFARGQLVSQRRSSSEEALLTTVRDFKGLEAPHVLVVDVDDVATDVAMAKLYVAMTRPRISLWIAVSPTAWQQLSEAPSGKGTR